MIFLIMLQNTPTSRTTSQIFSILEFLSFTYHKLQLPTCLAMPASIFVKAGHNSSRALQIKFRDYELFSLVISFTHSLGQKSTPEPFWGF